MITISKRPVCPAFGWLKFNNPGDAKVLLSDIGKIIGEQIEATPSFHPELKIPDYIIMPDHIHILIQAFRPLRKHLGAIIQALKSASTSRIRRILTDPDLAIFEEGFHDRIILSRRQMEIVRNYLRENPRRLAVRKAHPEYFGRVNRLRIDNAEYRAYGNFQLLGNPFKEQVAVHRADSEEKCARNRDQWLYTAANGGVLVSPFISRAEKDIRREADENGGKFILVTNEPMEGRYKPSGRDFALCEAGRMLIVSLGKEGELSRQMCLEMNALAAAICK